MKLAHKTLSIIRVMTAAWYVVWALLAFGLAVWLAGPVGHFWWPWVVFATLIALVGIQWVRIGCEQLVTNEPRRSQP